MHTSIKRKVNKKSMTIENHSTKIKKLSLFENIFFGNVHRHQTTIPVLAKP